MGKTHKNVGELGGFFPSFFFLKHRSECADRLGASIKFQSFSVPYK